MKRGHEGSLGSSRSAVAKTGASGRRIAPSTMAALAAALLLGTSGIGFAQSTATTVATGGTVVDGAMIGTTIGTGGSFAGGRGGSASTVGTGGTLIYNGQLSTTVGVGGSYAGARGGSATTLGTGGTFIDHGHLGTTLSTGGSVAGGDWDKPRKRWRGGRHRR